MGIIYSFSHSLGLFRVSSQSNPLFVKILPNSATSAIANIGFAYFIILSFFILLVYVLLKIIFALI